jgi:hypothetical protein
MSDSDFEIVDTSTIQFARRSRKPKYKTKPWEYNDAEGEHFYYKIAQRNYRRRHGVTETPYDHLIDPVLEREEEYSKLFPITLIEARLIVQEEEMKKQTSAVEKTSSDACNDEDSMVCSECGKLFTAYFITYKCEDCEDK